MRTFVHASIFLLLFLSGCATGNGVSRSVDALMQGYDGDVPGAAVLVSRHGEPLLMRAYGFADLEERTAVTAKTNFRLASVTKQFTAAAILLLAEDGRLGLDDRIGRWLPSLPAATEAVTIRHLLSHTSGLVDYEEVIPEGTTVQLRDADVLRLLEGEARTYFVPGTSYRYSNSGYALLALIAEKASGTSFSSLLRERIFLPLGMEGTLAFEHGTSTVANRAFGYSAKDDRWIRDDQSITSAVLGDGGVYSSIEDLAKWDAALHDERLLRRGSLQMAFTAATETDVADVSYGYGWRITGPTVWHSGETRGFRNVIIRNRETGLTVAVLTNRNATPPRPIALAIAKLFD
ncbi:MAG TPA: serine hydrolase domain-containing protein [Thermoanaerobaculia bacterium]